MGDASEVRSTGSNEDHWSTTVVRQGESVTSIVYGQSRVQLTEDASDLRSTGSHEGDHWSTTVVKQGEVHKSNRHGQSREEASDVRSPGSNEGGVKLSTLGRFRAFRSDTSWDE